MKRALKISAAGVFGVLFVGVVMASVTLRPDGIVFPDDTLQTTAAAAAVEAHPQHCYHSPSLGSLETAILTCYSLHPGDTTWGSGGVPAGYYFIVTDVMLDPQTAATDIGDVGFRLWHSDNCTGTPGNILSRSFRVVPNLSTTVWSFRAPTMILGPEHCLRVTADIGITVVIDVVVTGYLTPSPELLGP